MKHLLLLLTTMALFACSGEEAGDAAEDVQGAMSDVAEEAGEVADDAMDATSDTMDDVADAAGEMADDVGDAAEGAMAEGAEAMHGAMDKAKSLEGKLMEKKEEVDEAVEDAAN